MTIKVSSVCPEQTHPQWDGWLGCYFAASVEIPVHKCFGQSLASCMFLLPDSLPALGTLIPESHPYTRPYSCTSRHEVYVSGPLHPGPGTKLSSILLLSVFLLLQSWLLMMKKKETQIMSGGGGVRDSSSITHACVHTHERRSCVLFISEKCSKESGGEGSDHCKKPSAMPLLHPPIFISLKEHLMIAYLCVHSNYIHQCFF